MAILLAGPQANEPVSTLRLGAICSCAACVLLVLRQLQQRVALGAADHLVQRRTRRNHGIYAVLTLDLEVNEEGLAAGASLGDRGDYACTIAHVRTGNAVSCGKRHEIRR